MSPYENRLATDSIRRVGLVALVRPGAAADLAAAAATPPAQVGTKMANVHLFTRAAGEKTFLFVYLEYGGANVEAVPGLLRADPWFAALAPHLDAHPRATAGGTPWLRMELINLIGPTLPAPSASPAGSRSGLMSRLKPESELLYRSLHQTNWPGVVDQMARSHFRYWVTFLIEFGAELMLFTYCEYTGTDKQVDDAAMAADPVTCRWWAHTEPCLSGAPGHNGSWAPMETIAALT